MRGSTGNWDSCGEPITWAVMPRHPKSRPVPTGVCPFSNVPRKQVVVAKEPVIFGLGRMFEMCADEIDGQFQVVYTLEEAYKMVEDLSENFNACMLIAELA